MSIELSITILLIINTIINYRTLKIFDEFFNHRLISAKDTNHTEE